MNLMPLNAFLNLFYGYYPDSTIPINSWEKSLETLSKENPAERYLSFSEICFGNWEELLGPLEEREGWSLHLAILVPSLEIESINSIIMGFNCHDIEIVYNKDLFVVGVPDDFGYLRSNLTAISSNESILDVSFIIMKINPHFDLEPHIRQVISYLLATVFRMFSIQEGHVENWYNERRFSYGEEIKLLDYEKSLEYICTVNNYYVRETDSYIRDQLICSSIKVTPELLLQVNDVELTNKLFSNYNREMIKPSQTNIILCLKGLLK